MLGTSSLCLVKHREDNQQKEQRINNIQRKKIHTMNNNEWTKFEEVTNLPGIGYTDYINQENTQIKRVWNDGYEEIYDIA